MKWLLFGQSLALSLFCLSPSLLTAGELKLTVVDKDTKQPIPFRLHLKNQFGVSQVVPRLPYFKDHVVVPGTVNLNLRKGNYFFEIERGPEYLWQQGHFVMMDGAQDEKVVELRRFIKMADHGWYSGDLHVHRPVKDMELLMQADDLHVAPVITWWNKKNEWEKRLPEGDLVVKHDGNRFYHLMAGEDERGGGALLYLNMKQPLEIQQAQREFPSSVEYARQAKAQGDVHIDAEKPFWWDMPTWVALGLVDTIGVANNHMCRTSMLENEAWGRPRDAQRLRNPLGNGYYTQEIYYHLLNCGLRLPPSAGSASGVLPNPVGYNRVYAYVEGEFTYEKWFQALRAGHTFVTNGPLMRPLVADQLPGHTFTASQGEQISLQPFLSLHTRDKIDYLEIIQDGKLASSIRLDEYAKLQGKLPAVTFDRSGWFLIRLIAENTKTFRFACTAPYYVNIGGHTRISRNSAQFFLTWVEERIAAIEKTVKDPIQRQAALAPHLEAKKFWADLVARANAE